MGNTKKDALSYFVFFERCSFPVFKGEAQDLGPSWPPVLVIGCTWVSLSLSSISRTRTLLQGSPVPFPFLPYLVSQPRAPVLCPFSVQMPIACLPRLPRVTCPPISCGPCTGSVPRALAPLRGVSTGNSSPLKRAHPAPWRGSRFESGLKGCQEHTFYRKKRMITKRTWKRLLEIK